MTNPDIPLSLERQQEIRETYPGEWYSGPWTQEHVDSNGDDPAYCRVIHHESGTVLATLPDFAGPIALFIADAHDAVPELLAELDRVRAERDAWRDQRNGVFATNERLLAEVQESDQARLRAENETRTVKREGDALRARVAELEERIEHRRMRLVEADADLQEMRGLLSPNGFPRRVPPEVEIHERVAPAVEWLLRRVEELEKRLNDAAATRVWKNEDGKKFVFVEDIAPHLLGTSTKAGDR